MMKISVILSILLCWSFVSPNLHNEKSNDKSVSELNYESDILALVEKEYSNKTFGEKDLKTNFFNFLNLFNYKDLDNIDKIHQVDNKSLVDQLIRQGSNFFKTLIAENKLSNNSLFGNIITWLQKIIKTIKNVFGNLTNAFSKENKFTFIDEKIEKHSDRAKRDLETSISESLWINSQEESISEHLLQLNGGSKVLKSELASVAEALNGRDAIRKILAKTKAKAAQNKDFYDNDDFNKWVLSGSSFDTNIFEHPFQGTSHNTKITDNNKNNHFKPENIDNQHIFSHHVSKPINHDHHREIKHTLPDSTTDRSYTKLLQKSDHQKHLSSKLQNTLKQKRDDDTNEMLHKLMVSRHTHKLSSYEDEEDTELRYDTSSHVPHMHFHITKDQETENNIPKQKQVKWKHTDLSKPFASHASHSTKSYDIETSNEKRKYEKNSMFKTLFKTKKDDKEIDGNKFLKKINIYERNKINYDHLADSLFQHDDSLINSYHEKNIKNKNKQKLEGIQHSIVSFTTSTETKKEIENKLLKNMLTTKIFTSTSTRKPVNINVEDHSTNQNVAINSATSFLPNLSDDKKDKRINNMLALPLINDKSKVETKTEDYSLLRNSHSDNDSYHEKNIKNKNKQKLEGIQHSIVSFTTSTETKKEIENKLLENMLTTKIFTSTSTRKPVNINVENHSTNQNVAINSATSFLPNLSDDKKDKRINNMLALPLINDRSKVETKTEDYSLLRNSHSDNDSYHEKNIKNKNKQKLKGIQHSIVSFTTSTETKKEIENKLLENMLTTKIFTSTSTRKPVNINVEDHSTNQNVAINSATSFLPNLSDDKKDKRINNMLALPLINDRSKVETKTEDYSLLRSSHSNNDSYHKKNIKNKNKQKLKGIQHSIVSFTTSTETKKEIENKLLENVLTTKIFTSTSTRKPVNINVEDHSTNQNVAINSATSFLPNLSDNKKDKRINNMLALPLINDRSKVETKTEDYSLLRSSHSDNDLMIDNDVTSTKNKISFNEIKSYPTVSSSVAHLSLSHTNLKTNIENQKNGHNINGYKHFIPNTIPFKTKHLMDSKKLIENQNKNYDLRLNQKITTNIASSTEIMPSIMNKNDYRVALDKQVSDKENSDEEDLEKNLEENLENENLEENLEEENLEDENLEKNYIKATKKKTDYTSNETSIEIIDLGDFSTEILVPNISVYKFKKIPIYDIGNYNFDTLKINNDKETESAKNLKKIQIDDYDFNSQEINNNEEIEFMDDSKEIEIDDYDFDSQEVNDNKEIESAKDLKKIQINYENNLEKEKNVIDNVKMLKESQMITSNKYLFDNRYSQHEKNDDQYNYRSYHNKKNHYKNNNIQYNQQKHQDNHYILNQQTSNMKSSTTSDEFDTKNKDIYFIQKKEQKSNESNTLLEPSVIKKKQTNLSDPVMHFEKINKITSINNNEKKMKSEINTKNRNKIITPIENLIFNGSMIDTTSHTKQSNKKINNNNNSYSQNSWELILLEDVPRADVRTQMKHIYDGKNKNIDIDTKQTAKLRQSDFTESKNNLQSTSSEIPKSNKTKKIAAIKNVLDKKIFLSNVANNYQDYNNKISSSFNLTVKSEIDKTRHLNKKLESTYKINPNIEILTRIDSLNNAMDKSQPNIQNAIASSKSSEKSQIKSWDYWNSKKYNTNAKASILFNVKNKQKPVLENTFLKKSEIESENYSNDLKNTAISIDKSGALLETANKFSIDSKIKTKQNLTHYNNKKNINEEMSTVTDNVKNEWLFSPSKMSRSKSHLINNKDNQVNSISVSAESMLLDIIKDKNQSDLQKFSSSILSSEKSQAEYEHDNLQKNKINVSTTEISIQSTTFNNSDGHWSDISSIPKWLEKKPIENKHKDNIYNVPIEIKKNSLHIVRNSQQESVNSLSSSSAKSETNKNTNKNTKPIINSNNVFNVNKHNILHASSSSSQTASKNNLNIQINKQISPQIANIKKFKNNINIGNDKIIKSKLENAETSVKTVISETENLIKASSLSNSEANSWINNERDLNQLRKEKIIINDIMSSKTSNNNKNNYKNKSKNIANKIILETISNSTNNVYHNNLLKDTIISNKKIQTSNKIKTKNKINVDNFDTKSEINSKQIKYLKKDNNKNKLSTNLVNLNNFEMNKNQNNDNILIMTSDDVYAEISQKHKSEIFSNINKINNSIQNNNWNKLISLTNKKIQSMIDSKSDILKKNKTVNSETRNNINKWNIEFQTISSSNEELQNKKESVVSADSTAINKDVYNSINEKSEFNPTNIVKANKEHNFDNQKINMANIEKKREKISNSQRFSEYFKNNVKENTQPSQNKLKHHKLITSNIELSKEINSNETETAYQELLKDVTARTKMPHKHITDIVKETLKVTENPETSQITSFEKIESKSQEKLIKNLAESNSYVKLQIENENNSSTSRKEPIIASIETSSTIFDNLKTVQNVQNKLNKNLLSNIEYDNNKEFDNDNKEFDNNNGEFDNDNEEFNNDNKEFDNDNEDKNKNRKKIFKNNLANTTDSDIIISTEETSSNLIKDKYQNDIKMISNKPLLSNLYIETQTVGYNLNLQKLKQTTFSSDINEHEENLLSNIEYDNDKEFDNDNEEFDNNNKEFDNDNEEFGNDNKDKNIINNVKEILKADTNAMTPATDFLNNIESTNTKESKLLLLSNLYTASEINNVHSRNVAQDNQKRIITVTQALPILLTSTNNQAKQKEIYIKDSKNQRLTKTKYDNKSILQKIYDDKDIASREVTSFNTIENKHQNNLLKTKLLINSLADTQNMQKNESNIDRKQYLITTDSTESLGSNIFDVDDINENSHKLTNISSSDSYSYAETKIKNNTNNVKILDATKVKTISYNDIKNINSHNLFDLNTQSEKLTENKNIFQEDVTKKNLSGTLLSNFFSKPQIENAHDLEILKDNYKNSNKIKIKNNSNQQENLYKTQFLLNNTQDNQHFQVTIPATNKIIVKDEKIKKDKDIIFNLSTLGKMKIYDKIKKEHLNNWPITTTDTDATSAEERIENKDEFNDTKTIEKDAVYTKTEAEEAIFNNIASKHDIYAEDRSKLEDIWNAETKSRNANLESAEIIALKRKKNKNEKNILDNKLATLSSNEAYATTQQIINKKNIMNTEYNVIDTTESSARAEETQRLIISATSSTSASTTSSNTNIDLGTKYDQINNKMSTTPMITSVSKDKEREEHLSSLLSPHLSDKINKYDVETKEFINQATNLYKILGKQQDSEILLMKRNSKGPVQTANFKSNVPSFIAYRLIPQKIYEKIHKILVDKQIFHTNWPLSNS